MSGEPSSKLLENRMKGLRLRESLEKGRRKALARIVRTKEGEGRNKGTNHRAEQAFDVSFADLNESGGGITGFMGSDEEVAVRDEVFEGPASRLQLLRDSS